MLLCLFRNCVEVTGTGHSALLYMTGTGTYVHTACAYVYMYVHNSPTYVHTYMYISAVVSGGTHVSTVEPVN